MIYLSLRGWGTLETVNRKLKELFPMKHIVDYQVVRAESLSDLQNKVMDYCKRGYDVAGGIAMRYSPLDAIINSRGSDNYFITYKRNNDASGFFQALVKYSED